MTLERSIIATLTYSDHFSFPLTLTELRARLIKVRVTNEQTLLSAAKKMLKNNLIGKTGDFYHLPGGDKNISLRRKNQKISGPSVKKAQSLAKRISKVPGVTAIYLTGSLAVLNSPLAGDIDLMIVTRPHRLWTTRILLTLYTELFGLRRRPHSGDSPGKVCLNLYLTPDSFKLPESKQSLYTAYELIQAVPLYDPSDTHSALLAANSWIRNYLPNYRAPGSVKRSAQSRKSRSILKGFFDISLDYIELLAYQLQLLYMRKKMTREYITKNSAFFHPNNPGAKVLKKITL